MTHTVADLMFDSDLSARIASDPNASEFDLAVTFFSQSVLVEKNPLWILTKMSLNLNDVVEKMRDHTNARYLSQSFETVEDARVFCETVSDLSLQSQLTIASKLRDKVYDSPARDDIESGFSHWNLDEYIRMQVDTGLHLDDVRKVSVYLNVERREKQIREFAKTSSVGQILAPCFIVVPDIVDANPAWRKYKSRVIEWNLLETLHYDVESIDESYMMRPILSLSVLSDYIDFMSSIERDFNIYPLLRKVRVSLKQNRDWHGKLSSLSVFSE